MCGIIGYSKKCFNYYVININLISILYNMNIITTKQNIYIIGYFGHKKLGG
jgi:hypothetical protein